MKQFTHREFVRVVVANGFYYGRHSGDHARGKFVKMNTTYGFKWKKIEGENKDE